MILFKYPEKQREFAKVDRRLRRIIEYMHQYAYGKWGDDLVITEVWRDKEFDVHKYWRGVDVARLENGDDEELRVSVNNRFPYDHARPNLQTIPPMDHGTAPHHHVQVKPKEET